MFKKIIFFAIGVIGVWSSLGVAVASERTSYQDQVNYTEYQVEIIVFSNLNFNNISSKSQLSKEIFSEHNFNELSTTGMVNFYDQKTQVKLLLNEYNKLKKSSYYKVITYAANRYHMLPSQRNKKFLIKPTSNNSYLAVTEDDVIDNKSTLDPFVGTLVITPVRNTFNLAWDAIFSGFRLTKSIKVKAKEVCYFDHPAFGALVSIAEVKEQSKK